MGRTTMFPLPMALCVVVALAGCSTLNGNGDGDGEDAEAGSSMSETAPLDPEALDTGDYPTEPQPEFGPTDEHSILEYETQRLAEYVALPYEIDPELSESTNVTIHTIRAGEALIGAGLNSAESALVAERGLLYGFVGGGETETTRVTDPKKSLVTGVWRFESPESAQAAAAAITHYMQTGEGAPEKEAAEEAEFFQPATPEELPGRPDAQVVSMIPELDDSVERVFSFVPKGNYITYNYAETPVGEKQWSLDTISKSLEVQEPLTEQFVGYPTKEQRGDAEPPETIIDQDNVIIYTIPTQEDENNLDGATMASYGPRGLAHFYEDQKALRDAVTEAGAEHTGMWGTTVFRAKSDDAAQRLLDEFLRIDSDEDFKATDSPVGLPDAKCKKNLHELGRIDVCYVLNGRYIGVAQEIDETERVHQKISAQALILEKADQDA
ncbi:MAG TPA: hypothetical protein K8V11_06190 [Dietzia timorensis]|uniref:Uncharacterized protein n=1 Tax=Dietzia timorensis TaxID=499555 RepID=A0A921F369_9ACTN|nr:hypothetical protein [Dietzia timorensis]HJE90580.1 hypothetical protein [Dietzia timorensis]